MRGNPGLIRNLFAPSGMTSDCDEFQRPAHFGTTGEFRIDFRTFHEWSLSEQKNGIEVARLPSPVASTQVCATD